MQFTLKRAKYEISSFISDREIRATINGDILEEKPLEKTFDIDSYLGIEGVKVFIKIDIAVVTPLGTKYTKSFEIPIIIRNSSMVLIGSNGEKLVERAVIKILRNNYDIDLTHFIPIRENIVSLLDAAVRFEDVIVITEKGPLKLHEVPEYIKDYEEFIEKDSSDIWRRILLTYPLVSANIILKLEQREIFLRYFLDSFWLNERNSSVVSEFLVSILENHLIPEDE